MAWKFDPFKIDIVWSSTVEDLVDSASIDLGVGTGDLAIDAGDRTNEGSILDQGERILSNGNI